jgi:hypothetical protein
MGQVVISTGQPDFRKITQFALTNYNNTFAVPTTTKPASGVLYDALGGNVVPNPSLMRFLPFTNATGTPPTTTGMGFRIIGWNRYLDAAGSTFWYVPNVIADFTLSFTTGTVPSFNIDDTGDVRPFASITQVAGTPTSYLYSPGTANSANVEAAQVLVDITGAQMVTAQFKSTGSPTMGAFWLAI